MSHLMQKIHFRVTRDEDGYPPCDTENLWAVPDGANQFIIGNTPFFVHDIAIGDRIEARVQDGCLWFHQKLSSSGHATLRLLFFQRTQVEPVREMLRNLGCSSELSHLDNLISVDIPPSVNYDDITWKLIDLKEQGICEIEESCLPG